MTASYEPASEERGVSNLVALIDAAGRRASPPLVEAANLVRVSPSASRALFERFLAWQAATRVFQTADLLGSGDLERFLGCLVLVQRLDAILLITVQEIRAARLEAAAATLSTTPAVLAKVSDWWTVVGRRLNVEEQK